jgi:hypothetical protein
MHFWKMTMKKRRRRKALSFTLLGFVVSMTTIKWIFVVRAFTSIVVPSAYLFSQKKHRKTLVLYENNQNSFFEDASSNNDDNNNKGYRFGDLTRGALKRFKVV